eukprot:XP_020400937.1 uncharacterized protein LOC103642408 [Zea mays]
MAVRQTGSRDPHRRIRISDASAGGPQPASVARSTNPTVAPSPLDKGKGAASGASAPVPEDRRPTVRRGVSVLQSHRHHHHLWVITPMDTSSSHNSSSSSSDLLASRVIGRASSPSTPKVMPPPPDTRPIDGSGSQQQESSEGGAGGPPPTAARTAPAVSHALAGDPTAAAPASGGVAAVEEVPAMGSAPTPDTRGDVEGTSSSNPPPALVEMERDRKEYKRDLQRLCARELEASRREKKVTRREEAVTQWEALTIEYQAKLSALDQTLEAQWAQQVKAVERLQNWQQELEGKASDAALAEENLKVKEQSLDMRETDLVFREEMLTR